jgi:hypothetical protein
MAYLEKNLDLAARASDEIGAIAGFMRRESGEPHQSEPVNPSRTNDKESSVI